MRRRRDPFLNPAHINALTPVQGVIINSFSCVLPKHIDTKQDGDGGGGGVVEWEADNNFVEMLF